MKTCLTPSLSYTRTNLLFNVHSNISGTNLLLTDSSSLFHSLFSLFSLFLFFLYVSLFQALKCLFILLSVACLELGCSIANFLASRVILACQRALCERTRAAES